MSTFTTQSTEKELEMRDKNLRMVFFLSKEEADKAVRIKEFQDLRFGIDYGVGPCSRIVPARTVTLIRKKALVTKVMEPTAYDDLTPEQRRKIDDKKAGMVNFHGTEFFVPIELTVPWKKWSNSNATKKA